MYTTECVESISEKSTIFIPFRHIYIYEYTYEYTRVYPKVDNETKTSNNKRSNPKGYGGRTH